MYVTACNKYIIKLIHILWYNVNYKIMHVQVMYYIVMPIRGYIYRR